MSDRGEHPGVDGMIDMGVYLYDKQIEGIPPSPVEGAQYVQIAEGVWKLAMLVLEDAVENTSV